MSFFFSIDFINRVFALFFIQLCQEADIRALWNNQFFVQNGENTNSLSSDEVDHGLIIDEVDMIPLDSFCHIDGLLQFEGVVIEVLLKHLIGKIDAKLLERIELENLKPKNIQNANVHQTLFVMQMGCVLPEALIDALHQPIKHATIHKFAQRISRI
eukprot:Lithocolla_globosa_v1_NODE_401_length_4166_cov_3.956458.p2 type:complete len:157 gc:universal NODE_401_length_4166_cov_3.956458:1282-812(-)